MRGSLALSLEGTSSRMSRLGKSEVLHGEVLTVGQMLKRIESVTFDEAKRVANRVFSQPMSLSVIGPFKSRDFEGAMK